MEYAQLICSLKKKITYLQECSTLNGLRPLAEESALGRSTGSGSERLAAVPGGRAGGFLGRERAFLNVLPVSQLWRLSARRGGCLAGRSWTVTNSSSRLVPAVSHWDRWWWPVPARLGYVNTRDLWPGSKSPPAPVLNCCLKIHWHWRLACEGSEPKYP